MQSGHKVSVIIVNFRVKDVLRDCLLSLRSHAVSGMEVLIVDNASHDGSVEMVRAEFPEFQLIASNSNMGFSPANNVGMDACTGDLILLLNPDTIVKPGALQCWVDLHSVTKAGISGPKLLNADGSLQVSAWRIPGLLSSLLELFFLHRLFSTGNYPAETFNSDFSPECLSGAALLFDRAIYAKVGGLDPELFWMEDVDLCFRVSKAGYAVRYFHEPRITHLGGQSSKSNLNRVISNQLISRLKFASKHRNFLHVFALHLIVFCHILSRVLLFHLLLPIAGLARAKAYRFTFVKYLRYLFLHDRSI